MKAQRDSLFTQAGKIVGIKVRVTHNHEALVSEALDAFTKAEQKMEDSINLINDQIAEEAKIAREAEERMQSAKGSKDKLTRVLDRIKAFTA